MDEAPRRAAPKTEVGALTSSPPPPQTAAAARPPWTAPPPPIAPRSPQTPPPHPTSPPPPYVQHGAINRNRGCCVPTGGSANFMLVHRVSLLILFIHGTLLLNLFTYAWWDGMWGTLSVVQVLAYSIGIVSSTSIVWKMSKLSCLVCSILYPVVGTLDAIILFVGTFSTYFIGKSIGLDVAKAVGSMSCFIGSTVAFKVARSWDRD